MTAEKILYKQKRVGIHNFYYEDEDIILAMKEYARLKCQELLLLVAEKAKIIDEDGDIYEQPHVFYCQGERYETRVDKDSIFNAVDLEKFC